MLGPDLEPSTKERHGPVGAVLEQATAMIQGLKTLCCENRQGELGLFSLEQRRL